MPPLTPYKYAPLPLRGALTQNYDWSMNGDIVPSLLWRRKTMISSLRLIEKRFEIPAHTKELNFLLPYHFHPPSSLWVSVRLLDPAMHVS